MPIRSTLSSQIGLGAEVTPGTGVTVTRFFELVSEDLDSQREQIVSTAIRAGALLGRGADMLPGAYDPSGSITVDLTTKDMAWLLTRCIGSVTTTGSNPYTHTIVPSADRGAVTIQKGVTSESDGTVIPFTFMGMKCTGWELGVSGSDTEPIQFQPSFTGMSSTTATALATASYTSSVDLFAKLHASLTIGGSAVNIRDLTYSVDLGVPQRDPYIGATSRPEPVQSDRTKVSLSGTGDFVSTAAYARMVAGTDVQVVLAISRDASNSITFTSTMRQVEGAMPQIGGVEIAAQPFALVDSGTTDAGGLTCVVVSTEATP